MREKALVILQARMSSTRFPGKVLEEVSGLPMIIRQINRILGAKNIDKIVVATTKDITDDPLASLLLRWNIETYRGEMNDVISRFLGVMTAHRNSTVVRLTADCPLVMPNLIDCMIDEFWRMKCDYLSNTVVPTFPDGLDIEVFSRSSLLRLFKLELSDFEKEHVTLGFHHRREQFQMHNFSSSKDYSDLRWTVDYRQDLDFVRLVYSRFPGRESNFDFQEVLNLLEKDPSIKSAIPATRRNEALREKF